MARLKQLAMRKCSRTLSGVFVACLAFAAHGSTNVFNDAVFWFRGGKDKDLSGDGVGCMQQGEFFDDLNATNNSHANHQMSMQNYLKDTSSKAFKNNGRLKRT